MADTYWIYFILVSLEVSRIFVISFSRHGPSSLAILKYFRPPLDEPYFFPMEQDCTDPCVLNATFLSNKRKEAEERGCYRRRPYCTEEQKNSPYRTIDGRCNNLLNPDWGMAETCHRRFLPHDYGDGLSYPRLSCLKADLPNERIISNLLHRAVNPLPQEDMTLYTMEWGQLVAHDISLTHTQPLPDIGPGSCCDPHPRIDGECIAVPVPHNDDFYLGKRTCLALQRAKACPLCKRGVRQSLNNNTSYFDLSVVYGSTEEKLRSVRSYKNGMLLTQNIPGVGELPPAIEKEDGCKSLNSTHKCFHAGDERINQNLMLTSVQIVLLRNHNYICRKLKKVNPHWDDDRLFHEARKINIAQAQMITFGKYLRRVIGPGITSDPEFQLDVLPDRQFTFYNERVQATIYDEVASAAHRFGHTQVPNIMLEKDPVSRGSRNIHMKDNFFWPFDFYSGQFDRLALGMALKHPKYRSITLNHEVRNYLYDQRIEEQFQGIDLAALSIARVREHGIPGYTYYLKRFFNVNIFSFCDLKGWIPGGIIEQMKRIYRSVHDVNLYTGILAEYHVDRGIIGPLGAAMLAIQYWNFKFGDRYYFEHGGEAGSFTLDQLVEIKEKTRIAKMLCETTKISNIQPEVFYPVSKRNRKVSCKEIPGINFNLWKEEL